MMPERIYSILAGCREIGCREFEVASVIFLDVVDSGAFTVGELVATLISLMVIGWKSSLGCINTFFVILKLQTVLVVVLFKDLSL